MQTKEGEGTLTWSGELYGQAMGGVVTKRPSNPEKPAEHFQFSGTLVSQAPPTPTEPEPSPPASDAEGVASPATESAEGGRRSPEPQRGEAEGRRTPVAEPSTPQDAPPPAEPPKKRGWFW